MLRTLTALVWFALPCLGIHCRGVPSTKYCLHWHCRRGPLSSPHTFLIRRASPVWSFPILPDALKPRACLCHNPPLRATLRLACSPLVATAPMTRSQSSFCSGRRALCCCHSLSCTRSPVSLALNGMSEGSSLLLPRVLRLATSVSLAPLATGCPCMCLRSAPLSTRRCSPSFPWLLSPRGPLSLAGYVSVSMRLASLGETSIIPRSLLAA